MLWSVHEKRQDVLSKDHRDSEQNMFLRNKSRAYCSSSSCHVSTSFGLAFPNGLIEGKYGLHYGPDVFVNIVSVIESQSDSTLSRVEAVRVGTPIDNLSNDRDGDI